MAKSLLPFHLLLLLLLLSLLCGCLLTPLHGHMLHFLCSAWLAPKTATTRREKHNKNSAKRNRSSVSFAAAAAVANDAFSASTFFFCSSFVLGILFVFVFRYTPPSLAILLRLLMLRCPAESSSGVSVIVLLLFFLLFFLLLLIYCQLCQLLHLLL